MNEKEIRLYFDEIRRNLLNCSKSKSNAFLQEFRSTVRDFLQENPTASVEDVQAYFGTPLQIAEAFLQGSDFTEIQKTIYAKAGMNRSVRIALIVAILGILAFGLIVVIDTVLFNHGNYQTLPASVGTSSESADSSVEIY